MKTYTVLLLLPEYLESDYRAETYLAWVQARGKRSAIKAAQKQAARQHRADGAEVNKEDDYAVIFMCDGHIKDIAPSFM